MFLGAKLFVVNVRVELFFEVEKVIKELVLYRFGFVFEIICVLERKVVRLFVKLIFVIVLVVFGLVRENFKLIVFFGIVLVF